MKIVFIIVMAVTLCASTANAGLFEGWDSTDKTLFSAYTLFWTADWGQTRYISTHDEYYELNDYLGEHPTTREVDTYFLGWYVANYFISDYLKPDLRKPYLLLWTLEHARWVIHNNSIGIGFNFSF